MDHSTRRDLFVGHRESLKRFVRRLSSSDDEAEEMIQDVAVIVLAHRTGPSETESYFGWCCGVARHVAAHRRRSYARKSTMRDPFCERDVEAALTSGMLDDVEQMTMTRQELAVRLDGLDVTAVALLHDRFVLEETATEIATRLNRSAASVRMRIARLLSVLRPSDVDAQDEKGAGSASSRESGCYLLDDPRDELAPESELRHSSGPMHPQHADGASRRSG